MDPSPRPRNSSAVTSCSIAAVLAKPAPGPRNAPRPNGPPSRFAKWGPASPDRRLLGATARAVAVFPAIPDYDPADVFRFADSGIARSDRTSDARGCGARHSWRARGRHAAAAGALRRPEHRYDLAQGRGNAGQAT